MIMGMAGRRAERGARSAEREAAIGLRTAMLVMEQCEVSGGRRARRTRRAALEACESRRY